jgi:hypothetical protein
MGGDFLIRKGSLGPRYKQGRERGKPGSGEFPGKVCKERPAGSITLGEPTAILEDPAAYNGPFPVIRREGVLFQLIAKGRGPFHEDGGEKFVIPLHIPLFEQDRTRLEFHADVFVQVFESGIHMYIHVPQGLSQPKERFLLDHRGFGHMDGGIGENRCRTDIQKEIRIFVTEFPEDVLRIIATQKVGQPLQGLTERGIRRVAHIGLFQRSVGSKWFDKSQTRFVPKKGCQKSVDD